MEQLINYKKLVASRYFPLEGEQVKKGLPNSDAFIYCEKIDGHLGYAVVRDNGDVAFYNRSGKALDLPELASVFPKVTGIWAGELYVKREGERSRSFHISSAIVNEKDSVHFLVFDAVHALELPVFERIALIEEHIPKADKVHPVDWHRTDTKSDIIDFYQTCVDAGKEGIVVHTQQGRTYKAKPVIELDVCVLGYSLKEDGTGMRSLLVGLKTDDAWVVLASVGGGYSAEDRMAWMEKLAPMEVDCGYVMVAKNGLAYKWIKPELVVQIKCIEAITEDATGEIFKETMSFNDGTYEFEGKISAVSLLSPVFMGVRDDKTPGADDTGLSQISSRIEIKATKNNATNATPEILARKVYTKTSKKGIAIRKFTAVQTNAGEDFAQFYVYYTDFSMGRKDPLKADIHTVPSKEKIMQVFEQVMADNVKKGWVEA